MAANEVRIRNFWNIPLPVIVTPVNQEDIRVIVQDDNDSKRSLRIYFLILVDEYFKELFMKQQVDIFLFVNPLSGGRQGQKFLDMGFKKL